ncbi:MAG: MMPL family transporter [Candidatus Latescibacteria bacterium]|nr:MMPL family transporter [Candidatus Latescibacterota bacterium]
MIKFEQHSRKSSLIVFFLLGLLTVFLASGLPKLETRNNYESDLPDSDDVIKQNRRVEDVFGKKDELIIVVCAENILQPSTLQKIVTITEEVKNIPGVEPHDIMSLSEIDHIDFHDGILKVGPLMRQVPANENEIADLRREIDDDSLIFGRIISHDYTRTIIMAHLGEGYNQHEVDAEAKRIQAQYNGPEKIYVLGEPIIGEEVDRAIEGDIKKLFPVAFALLLVLFLLFFRSFTGVILPAGVIVLSVIWTMGLAGHIGYPLTVVSSTIPVLLVAVASSYGIHVVHSYHYFLHRESSIDNALSLAVKSIRKPVIITGITSAIGSATLFAFRVTSIREFGLLSAAGFIFAMVLALTLVPAVFNVRGRKNAPRHKSDIKHPSLFDTFLDWLKYIPLRKRNTVFLICTLLIVASAIGSLRLRVGMDPVDYFPEDFPFSKNVADFDAHFGGARKMYIMVEGLSETVKNPNILNKILAFQKEAEKNPIVGSSFSFADVIRRTNLVLHDKDRQYDRIPETESEVAQAALVYSSVSDPEKYESIVSHDFYKTKITLDVRTSDVEAHSKLYQHLKTTLEQIFGSGEEVRFAFGGMIMVWIAQIRYIVVGKMINIIMSLFFLWIVATIVFRTWKLGLFAIFPVSLAILINFGIMGFSGIRLNMGTAIITAMGAGIGVDFAVHYLVRLKDNLVTGISFQKAVNTTVDSSGKAIIVDMTSNLIGFAVFMLSPFTPVFQFGWLICLTMIASAFGALLLIPASMSFLYGATTDEKTQ